VVPIPPAQALSLVSRSLPLITQLNRRFVAGAPSNSLYEAGVPLHVLDGYERSNAPWSFDPSSPTGDRASASIVNARHPDVYENLLRPVGSQRMPGFVLADAPTKERLSCSYFRDGGTNSASQNCDHTDTSCASGCIASWCEGDMDWYCAFPPWRLKDMMEAHDREVWRGHHPHWSYNELVLDTWRKPWELDMPHMVVAVFVQAGSEEAEVMYGLAVHSKLLAFFNLSENDVPLLEYDATSASEPFRSFGGARKSTPLVSAGEAVPRALRAPSSPVARTP
jgi:hypothetical protein